MAHQLERLEALGCHRAQGFLFSPAVPASQVPALFGRSGPRSTTPAADDQVA